MAVPYPFVSPTSEPEPATMTLKPTKAVFCIECGAQIEPGHISGLWCVRHYTKEKAAALANAIRCNLCGGSMPPRAPDSGSLRLAHGACLENWIHDIRMMEDKEEAERKAKEAAKGPVEMVPVAANDDFDPFLDFDDLP